MEHESNHTAVTPESPETGNPVLQAEGLPWSFGRSRVALVHALPRESAQASLEYDRVGSEEDGAGGGG